MRLKNHSPTSISESDFAAMLIFLAKYVNYICARAHTNTFVRARAHTLTQVHARSPIQAGMNVGRQTG